MKKNQKPIDIDGHLLYRCPNIKCKYDHWLSIKEAQTKNYKVVCDCGQIFKPKTIKKLKIVYEKISEQKPEQSDKKEPIVESIVLPDSLKNSCSKLLMSYGFTEPESNDLIEKAYNKTRINNPSALIKYILQNLETINA